MSHINTTAQTVNRHRGVPFFPPLPGHFVHGVDLNNWYPCWNLALSGQLSSPDFFASIDPGVAKVHRRIRDTPLDQLREKGLPVGTPTPRAVWCLLAAAVARNGGSVGVGVTNTHWFSRETMDEYRKRGDVELAFEKVRRLIAPEAPSRLSCLYLAEDSDAGRTHVRAMLGATVHIQRVRVPMAIRVHKADTAWFDRYCTDPNPEYIRNYWQSAPSGSESTTWEFLIDGCIQVDDEAAIAYLRKHGAHLEVDAEKRYFCGESKQS